MHANKRPANNNNNEKGNLLTSHSSLRMNETTHGIGTISQLTLHSLGRQKK